MTAFDTQHGTELWRSDGTESGTYIVKDINPGSAYGFDYNAVNSVILNGYLYFTANDGTSPAIWRTDGTGPGTVKVITIPNNENYQSTPKVIAVMGNMLFFTANIDNSSYGNHSLWVSDGTQNASIMLGNFPGNSAISQYIVYDNKLYFVAMSSEFGMVLFKTDGTTAGTGMVSNGFLGYIHSFYWCGNYLYFGVNGFPYDDKLFRTDGTAEGTVQLDGFQISAAIHEYECVEDTLLYLKGTFPQSISYTNGTDVGQLNLDIINAGDFTPNNQILNLGHVGSKLYFSARTAQYGEELYVADLDDVLSVNEAATTLARADKYIVSYPNPTTGLLNVSTGDGSLLETVTVYDLYGKKLFSVDVLRKNLQVDLSALSRGIYLVVAKTETGLHTRKVVLK